MIGELRFIKSRTGKPGLVTAILRGLAVLLFVTACNAECFADTRKVLVTLANGHATEAFHFRIGQTNLASYHTAWYVPPGAMFQESIYIENPESALTWFRIVGEDGAEKALYYGNGGGIVYAGYDRVHAYYWDSVYGMRFSLENPAWVAESQTSLVKILAMGVMIGGFIFTSRYLWSVYKRAIGSPTATGE